VKFSIIKITLMQKVCIIGLMRCENHDVQKQVEAIQFERTTTSKYT